MRVLISGAGIAGPALAYWLDQYGFEVTIVEKAPRLRSGGYIIDFWGLGFEVAERMGLLPEIRDKGYLVRQVRVVNRGGIRVAEFPGAVFSRIAQGRYISLARSDLSRLIHGKIRGRVETIFGDSITAIQQTGEGVTVAFEHGSPREFDLVAGADGLHSRVRELAFGPESRFEKSLGYKAAAFEVPGYHPRDDLTYVMYTEVHQQVARFSMHNDRTMFLLTFADGSEEINEAGDLQAQKALLRKRFSGSGWECPRILDALDGVQDLYFDRVSQIRMDARKELWTCGRVILIGDAAFCVSLLAGQGSALAMAAAYLLAGELRRAGGDYRQAFGRYQEIFAPFIRSKQQAALRFAGVFAPNSATALFLRNRIMNLLRIPWVADLTFARDLRDDLVLPEY